MNDIVKKSAKKASNKNPDEVVRAQLFSALKVLQSQTMKFVRFRCIDTFAGLPDAIKAKYDISANTLVINFNNTDKFLIKMETSHTGENLIRSGLVALFDSIRNMLIKAGIRTYNHVKHGIDTPVSFENSISNPTQNLFILPDATDVFDDMTDDYNFIVAEGDQIVLLKKNIAQFFKTFDVEVEITDKFSTMYERITTGQVFIKSYGISKNSRRKEKNDKTTSSISSHLEVKSWSEIRVVISEDKITFWGKNNNYVEYKHKDMKLTENNMELLIEIAKGCGKYSWISDITIKRAKKTLGGDMEDENIEEYLTSAMISNADAYQKLQNINRRNLYRINKRFKEVFPEFSSENPLFNNGKSTIQTKFAQITYCND